MRNLDLVRSIGADRVIHYTTTDFTRNGQRYDLLLDIAGSRRLSACRRVLTRTGTVVQIGGPAGRWLQPAGHAIATLARGPFVSQRVTLADVVASRENRPNLQALTTLIEDGKVTPVIDRHYPLADLPAAITYQETGRAPGKVVVTV